MVAMKYTSSLALWKSSLPFFLLALVKHVRLEWPGRRRSG
jgi:hypothetical protein